MSAKNAPWSQCPARGPSLGHIQSMSRKPDGQCIYCGVPFDFANNRWGAGDRIPANVSPELAREYVRVRAEGLGDQDAQALVAHLHGLSPGEDQKRPWKLEELQRLMILRKTINLLSD